MPWAKLLEPQAPISRRLYLGLGFALFILILILWSILTYGGFVSPTLLPTPGRVLSTGFNLFTNFNLSGDIFISVFRVTAGFLLAAAVGVPLGIFMGTLTVFEGLFEPIIGFIRYMPASAFIPLFILWIGLGENQKIAVIFFGTFFQLTLMIVDVAKNVPTELIEVSYTLGANKLDVFTKVIIPASLPGILDTLRITFGWAWTYLVVAEIVGATSGLGYMIMYSARFLRPDRIIVGILIIGLLGMMADYLFKVIYRRAFPWLRREGH